MSCSLKERQEWEGYSRPRGSWCGVRRSPQSHKEALGAGTVSPPSLVVGHPKGFSQRRAGHFGGFRKLRRGGWVRDVRSRGRKTSPEMAKAEPGCGSGMERGGFYLGRMWALHTGRLCLVRSPAPGQNPTCSADHRQSQASVCSSVGGIAVRTQATQGSLLILYLHS